LDDVADLAACRLLVLGARDDERCFIQAAEDDVRERSDRLLVYKTLGDRGFIWEKSSELPRFEMVQDNTRR